MSKPLPIHRIPPLIFAMTFVIISGIDIYVPISPQLAEVFQVSDATMKFSFILGPLGCCIMGIPFGYLSDRRGRRPLMFLGIALYLIGSLACAFSHNMESFFIGRAIQAAGVGGIGVVNGAILADLFRGITLGRHMATFGALVPITFSIAPILGAQIEHYLGWRAIFYFLFLAMCIVATPFLVFVPETSSKSKELKRLIPGLWELFTCRLTSTLAITHSAPITVAALFTVSGPFLYQQVYGFTSIGFSLIQAIPVGAQFFGALVYGRTVQKYGLAGCMRIGAKGVTLFIFACGLVLLGLIPPDPYYAVAIICLFSCVATFIISSAATLLLDHSPQDKGLTVSFLTLGKNIILAILVAVASMSPHNSAYPMLLWMFCIASVVLMLVLSCLRDIPKVAGAKV